MASTRGIHRRRSATRCWRLGVSGRPSRSEFLPSTPSPHVDSRSIRVSASRAGRGPSVMAATVAAPLARNARPDLGHRARSLHKFARQSPSIHAEFHRPQHDRAAVTCSAITLARRFDERPAVACRDSARPIRPQLRCSAGADPKTIDQRDYDVADTGWRANINRCPRVGESRGSAADQRRCVSRSIQWRCRMRDCDDDVRMAIINANTRPGRQFSTAAAEARDAAINRKMRPHGPNFRRILITSLTGQFRPALRCREVEDFRRNSRSIAVQKQAGGDPDHQAGDRQSLSTPSTG